MITDNTGAKKIEGTDNWRLIFDAHNDSVDAHSQAIQQIATVITGTTNNSGHAISANKYFIADGAKYKASQTIDTGATWAGKCTSVSDHDLINALNSKITRYEAYKDAYMTSDVLALALSESNNLITYFGSDATNKPSTQGGIALCLPMRGNMKIVIFFEALGNVYSNTYFNYAWTGWLKLTPQ